MSTITPVSTVAAPIIAKGRHTSTCKIASSVCSALYHRIPAWVCLATALIATSIVAGKNKYTKIESASADSLVIGMPIMIALDSIRITRNTINTLTTDNAITKALKPFEGSKVYNMIWENFDKKTPTLDLSNQDLTDNFPLDVLFKYFTHLTQIDLSGNNFHNIPDSISQLKLQAVNLSKNPLGHIPAGILASKTIVDLEISEIGLESIPDNFADMPLIALDISNNALKAKTTGLPKGLLIPTLQYLNVSGMKLSSLDGINQMKNLTKFSASRNKLNNLPVDLFARTQELVSIDLSCNPVKSLPRIDHLKELKELNVEHTPVGKVLVVLKISQKLNITR
jgi:Leucine-rich repeat (LRR) protein